MVKHKRFYMLLGALSIRVLTQGVYMQPVNDGFNGALTD
jgi:hypothetical protein